MSQPWQPHLTLMSSAAFRPTRAAACGREPFPISSCQLNPGEPLALAGRSRGRLILVEARPFGPHGSSWYALLPESAAVPSPAPSPRPAEANLSRCITLASRRRIPLEIYLAAIRLAIANPDVEFKEGLSSWWPTTGAEIRRQFLRSVHDRINQATPYLLRRT